MQDNLEDTEVLDGQATDTTVTETPQDTEALAGQEPDAIKSGSEEDQGNQTKAPTLDEEVVFEVGGKSYTMKQSQIVEALEKANALTEKEKALIEKEKSFNRDYTQKSQANAQFRKTIETTFGRFPENEELKALGKIWKSYFSNSQAKQLIDQVLTGQFNAANGSGERSGKVDPYIQQLESKISELEERLGGFSSSLEERDQQAVMVENQRTFSTWAKSKEAQGIKITEEVDRSMAPFVRALRQAQPEWTPEKVLDEAYKHATIDQLKQDVAKQTLISADKAKKQGIIRVTPKGGAKPDESKSYKEMLMESA